jgi:hypothetical protein
MHMKRNSLSIKYLLIGLITLSLFTIILPSAHADGIIIDGVIDETEWSYWFTDDSDSPVVDVYSYNDSSNVYIGILTDDATDNDDSLEFAFRASRRDYWFKLKSDGSAWWRSGEEGVEGWWNGMNTGLPIWFTAVASTTDGNRSYEISITLTCMEEKADNFPDNFVFWYKVQDENPGGPCNFYTDSLSGWWFVMGQYPEGEEPRLEFAVPELPLGTIMALVSMFAAIAIFAKKSSLSQLRL